MVSKKSIGKTDKITLLVVVTIVFIGIAPLALPPAIDWRDVFRPAALKLVSGASPYSVKGFIYPPWVAVLLLPIALLPDVVGRVVLIIANLVVFGHTARRLGASPLVLMVFLLSPPVLHCLVNGNIDWIVILGVVLPPQIGLFFIAIKPQIVFVVGIYWLVEAWRKDGWREVWRISWPVSVAMLLSLAVFGPWPFQWGEALSFWWNASLWPASIPVGLALLVAAIRKRRIEYAMGASPCLSPYVLFHSWVGALLAVVKSAPETVAAVVGLWILVGIRALQ